MGGGEAKLPRTETSFCEAGTSKNIEDFFCPARRGSAEEVARKAVERRKKRNRARKGIRITLLMKLSHMPGCLLAKGVEKKTRVLGRECLKFG